MKMKLVTLATVFPHVLLSCLAFLLCLCPLANGNVRKPHQDLGGNVMRLHRWSMC